MYPYIFHWIWYRVFGFTFFFHLISRTTRVQEKPSWPMWPELHWGFLTYGTDLFLSTLLFFTNHATTIVVAQLGKQARWSEPETLTEMIYMELNAVITCQEIGKFQVCQWCIRECDLVSEGMTKGTVKLVGWMAAPWFRVGKVGWGCCSRHPSWIRTSVYSWN